MKKENKRKDTLRLIAPEGLPLIGLSLLGIVITVILGLKIPAGIFTVLTFFLTYFFRDPQRNLQISENHILCPADGRIVSVESKPGESLSPSGFHKISIFMSPFNVHVNRAPVEGTVIQREKNGRKFFAANRPRSSQENVQVALTIKDGRGNHIVMKQIVGAIARRIVCYPQVGDQIKQGQRIGIIRFGSRVEILIPRSARIKIKPGEKVKAGETIIGEWQ